jgi:hypothetical protein
VCKRRKSRQHGDHSQPPELGVHLLPPTRKTTKETRGRRKTIKQLKIKDKCSQLKLVSKEALSSSPAPGLSWPASLACLKQFRSTDGEDRVDVRRKRRRHGACIDQVRCGVEWKDIEHCM